MKRALILVLIVGGLVPLELARAATRPEPSSGGAANAVTLSPSSAQTGDIKITGTVYPTTGVEGAASGALNLGTVASSAVNIGRNAIPSTILGGLRFSSGKSLDVSTSGGIGFGTANATSIALGSANTLAMTFTSAHGGSDAFKFLTGTLAAAEVGFRLTTSAVDVMKVWNNAGILTTEIAGSRVTIRGVEVDTTGASTNDVLTYNGSKWVKQTPSAGTPTDVTETSGGMVLQNSDSTPTSTELTDGITFRLGNGTTPDWRGTRGWHWLYSTGSGEQIAMQLQAPQNSASGAVLRFPRYGGGIQGELFLGQDTSGGTHDVLKTNGLGIVTSVSGYGLGDQDNPWTFTNVTHPGGGGSFIGTVTAGPGAGTSPSISVTAGSNDADFEISLGTGTSPTAGAQTLFTVNFQSAWSHAGQGGWNRAPKCVFSPTASNAANLSTISAGVFISSVSTTQLVFNTTATLAASTGGYTWAFHCAN